MAWHGLARRRLYARSWMRAAARSITPFFKIENGRPVRMTEDRPIALEELAKEAHGAGRSGVPHGDGAALCFEYFTANGVPCVMAG